MLEVDRVSKRYFLNQARDKPTVDAVIDVSLTVSPGECVCLIGESGSGKSTLTRLVLGLERPDRGMIAWRGLDIAKASRKEMKSVRKDIQAVFQDGEGSLNPRWRVSRSILEPLRNFEKLTPGEEQRRAARLFYQVGLDEALLARYPHELSGGEQKRVCIARAIAANPELIVLDEAVSGLDATVKKKILLLLKSLQDTLGCSYLFVTHDLDAAMAMAKKIAVMKDGRIVELVENADDFAGFRHPYSRKLIACRPRMGRGIKQKQEETNHETNLESNTGIHADPWAAAGGGLRRTGIRRR